jgi:uncharacterized membrane protein
LPDWLFSHQKSQSEYIFGGHEIENVGKCYGLLQYFTGIWHILLPFLIHFSRFGMLNQEKSGNPGFEPFW